MKAYLIRKTEANSGVGIRESERGDWVSQNHWMIRIAHVRYGKDVRPDPERTFSSHCLLASVDWEGLQEIAPTRLTIDEQQAFLGQDVVVWANPDYAAWLSQPELRLYAADATSPIVFALGKGKPTAENTIAVLMPTRGPALMPEDLRVIHLLAKRGSLT